MYTITIFHKIIKHLLSGFRKQSCSTVFQMLLPTYTKFIVFCYLLERILPFFPTYTVYNHLKWLNLCFHTPNHVRISFMHYSVESNRHHRVNMCGDCIYTTRNDQNTEFATSLNVQRVSICQHFYLLSSTCKYSRMITWTFLLDTMYYSKTILRSASLVINIFTIRSMHRLCAFRLITEESYVSIVIGSPLSPICSTSR